MKIEQVKPDELMPYAKNAKNHTPYQINQIASSIKEFGFNVPVLVDKEGTIVAGHGRVQAAIQLGMETVPCVRIEHLTKTQLRAFAIADNKTQMITSWDEELLALELQEIMEEDPDMVALTAFSKQELETLFADVDGYDTPKNPGALSEQFLVPPYSIMDTRLGPWIERRRKWLDIGIKSTDGRQISSTTSSPSINKIMNMSNEGGSTFDPVLAEILYEWYGCRGQVILDPFAGGSVRGIVAGYLGFKYHGIDLRPEQVAENQFQAEKMAKRLKEMPEWIVGDSMEMLDQAPEADLMMSCPPYADLEVYSDDPRDISNMEYDKFLEIYEVIIQKACAKLRENRFAAWVISDVRDKKGIYRRLDAETKSIFERAGLKLYNEIILINSFGSAALRAGRVFKGMRKVVRVHQNVLIFVKGDPKVAHEYLGPVNCQEESEEDGAEK